MVKRKITTEEVHSDNSHTAKQIKMIEMPKNKEINRWDVMFRAMLSVKPESLSPNLNALYTAILLSLPKNDESPETNLYQRLQSSPKLFKAVKAVPGLRLENGEFTLEAGHSIFLFGG